jgi:Tfp pilus assembly protein PilF
MERHDTHALEEESRRAFINLLPSDWVHRDQVPDYHLDMEIVVADKGKLTNEVFWVQIKATENIAHSHDVIPFSIETRHLKYYEHCRLPVIVVLWVKPEGTFYHLFAQQYIRERLSKEDPKWRTQETKTIKFSANSKLKSAETLESVATDGYLYIIQQEPAAKPGEGLASPWLDGIPKSNDRVLKERTLKALLYMRKEDCRSAIKEYESILRVVCRTPSTERMAILLNLGDAYYSLGEISEALENYNAVLELAKEITGKDVLQGEAEDLCNIGQIHFKKSNSESALTYLQDSLKIYREIGYKQGESIALTNIGLVYQDMRNLSQALRHLLGALEILDRCNLSYGRDVIQEAISSIAKTASNQ